MGKTKSEKTSNRKSTSESSTAVESEKDMIESKTTVQDTDAINEQLSNAEKKIEKAIAAFWEAAEALEKIRSFELYKNNYKSFPEYLAARWGYTRSYASRLITAKNTREKLLKDETIENQEEKLPKAYSFFYCLSRFKFDEQLSALKELLDSGEKMTVEKLKELTTPEKDEEKTQDRRLRNAISTFKSLADNFDPDKFFIKKSGSKSANESKEDFIKALRIILDKLEKKVESKTDD